MRSCYALLLLCGVPVQAASAQVTPLPRLWGGVGLGIGVAMVPTGGRDTAYRGGPLAVFQLGGGMRISKRLGLAVDYSRIVNGLPEGCHVPLPAPNCAPGVEYGSLTGMMVYGGTRGPVVAAGIGGYHLKAGEVNPTTNTLGFHLAVETPLVRRQGGGLTAGLRTTWLPHPPGRSIGILSLYVAARGWDFAPAP